MYEKIAEVAVLYVSAVERRHTSASLAVVVADMLNHHVHHLAFFQVLGQRLVWEA